MAVNVAQFLLDRAASQPKAPAVRIARGRKRDGSIRYKEVSFGALESLASAATRLLINEKVGEGDRVLLMVRPGLDLICIVFALFKMGAVPIVIDPGMGLKKFLQCVERSRPKAVIGITSAIVISHLFRRRFPATKRRIRIGRGFQKSLRSWTRDDSIPVVNSASDDLAAILFTSGSTGPAKGVCYNHGMFKAQVEAIRSVYEISPGEVDLTLLPVFALFNPALGMCTVVAEMDPSRPAAVDPQKIVQAIQQNKVTNSFGSPALWRKLAGYCIHNDITLPSVKRVLIAGAPVPPSLMKDMKTILCNGSVHTPYGATEALPVSSISVDEVVDETAGQTNIGAGTCVGRPLPAVEVKVVDYTAAQIASLNEATELPEGAIGEIIVSGPSVTSSYDGLPEATARAKIANGDRFWHRMGDLGYMDSQQRLWFCGRAVERVPGPDGVYYTDCCEAIFNQVSGVVRSALIDLGGGVPAIVIEPTSDAFPDDEAAQSAFIRRLRAKGAQYQHTAKIEAFFFERSFPVDVRHNAKIHRLSLAKKYQKITTEKSS